MYFAVVKLRFEARPDGATDRRDLRALAEKIRARFKVCAAVCADAGDEGHDALAIAALGSSADKLSQAIDAIGEFCETCGFGRVESEDALLDHIDALGDYESDGDGRD